MPVPQKDMGMERIAELKSQIADVDKQLEAAQQATAALRAQAASQKPSSQAYVNLQKSITTAQANELNLRTSKNALSTQLNTVQTTVDARRNPPPSPQTEEERVQGIKNIQEKEKNEKSGKGYYTDQQLLEFQNKTSVVDAATLNAQTNSRVAEANATHEVVVEDYNRTVAQTNKDIAERKLSVEQGQLLINQKYNDAKIQFDRIEAENKAATTLLQDETTKRGQDTVESDSIRKQVGTNTGNFLDFLKETIKFLPRGKILTWEDINKLSASWDDMNQKQVKKSPRTPKSGDSISKQALESTAQGTKTVGIKTVAEEEKEKPAPGTVEAAIDTVRSQYDEWVAAGGDGDWTKFREHANAIGSSAPETMPASFAPAPPPVEVVPPSVPSAPAEEPVTPDPATNPTQQSIQMPQSQVPGSSGVGGITINVGPPSAPVAPPMAPPVQKPEQDEDYNTATSAATYDLLDGIVDEDVRNKFRVEPNQMGAFAQHVMGQLQ